MGREKYSIEEKEAIVKRVLKGEIGSKRAGQEIGCDYSDIRKWVAAYKQHGRAGIESHSGRYSGEFKQAVIEDMRENSLSLREVTAKYNIATHGTVSKWERIYLEEGPKGLYEERRGRACATGENRKGRKSKLNKQTEEDLIAENQRLRAEVDYLKKLNALVQEREQQERRPK